MLRLTIASLLLVVALPAMAPPPVRAQEACQAEAEPNDEPATAAPFAGPGCAAGSLPGEDTQDLHLWTLSESDAAAFWHLSLTGIPGAATSLQVLPIISAPGATPPEMGSPLVRLDAPPEAVEPLASGDLLLPPGVYIIAVVRSDFLFDEPPSTPYELSLERGAALPTVAESEPNDDATAAFPVADEFALIGDRVGSDDVFAWTLGETPAGEAVTLRAQGRAGADFTLSLASDEGASLLSTYSDDDALALLSDLRLPAGRYQVTIGRADAGPEPYVLTASFAPTGEGDPEPNDTVERALGLSVGSLVSGRLDRPADQDLYRLDVDEASAGLLLDAKVLGPGAPARELCLSTIVDAAAGDVLRCSSGEGPLAIPALGLAAGPYLLTVRSSEASDVPYYLRVDATAPPAADFEVEPNDRSPLATAMTADIEMRGRTTIGDDDYYRVVVDGEPQLWGIDVTGGALDRLEWVQADGVTLASGTISGDRTLASISDMYLEPGAHWFRVAGNGGYTLRLTPLGAPDPAAEREPNDDAAHAEVLLVGGERTGRLPLASDIDTYRFSLAATEHIRLAVEPPTDGAAALWLASGPTTFATRRAPEVGEALSYDALLPPGDYLATLRPGVVSSEPYRLSLSRLDPFVLAADQEPNDVPSLARPFPAPLRVDGTGTPDGDEDWYRLPAVAAGEVVTVRYAGQVGSITLSDGTADLPAVDDRESGLLTSEPLASDAPLYLRVQASGDYRVELAAPGLVAQAPPDQLPVRLSIVHDVVPVAAYEAVGQRLPAVVEVANEGQRPVELALDAETSHYGWSVALDQADVTVPAGSSVQVPATIVAAPDAWADIPVRATVRARDASGAQATAWTEVTPARGVPAVGPVQAWAVPDALLGGLDVASLAAGALPLGDVDAAQEALLHDGATRIDMGFSTDASRLPVTLTVDLAGDEPVPVVGTILDPLARDASLAGAPREFELRLSTDGSDFQTVLQGTLEPLMLDQAFVLDEPVDARFAQLVIRSNHGGANAPLQLGEWKVVASPGTATPPAARNIADPLRGGHVAWMQPQLGDATFTEGMLSEDPANTLVNLEARTPVEWVVAFRADRAAQVTELQWVDGPSADPAARFDRVDVSASLVSPVGPWRDLGTWQLERAADGSVSPMTLAEPTWARYLRFSGVGGSKTSYTFDLPATLRVIERDGDAQYRSILGEWGTDRPAGPYEWLQPATVEDAEAADAADTPEAARPLPAGERVLGRAHADEDVDWYALTVPEGQNTLEFVVSGRPTVGISLVLTDAAGEAVPMLFSPGEELGTVSYRATVTPGVSYRVQVAQPPSSVVFAFDTSGSMGPYLAFVLQALRAFADGVTPGREAVLITPFEEEPLLPDWSDQSYVLKEAVRSYVIGSGSSSAETALVEATTALSAREGARAILLVTDAETTSSERTPELWRALGSVRPLIAAVHVGATTLSAEGLTGRTAGDLMRDWAASAGGFYQYTRTHGEMDRAFDRLATWLRRPAGYGLNWTASYEEPPRESRKPGSITVTGPTGETSSAPGGATARGVSTEIILDTSGSMLERIGSKRKIDIARAVLDELVTRRLPAGAPVALRVFGNDGSGGGGGGDPCATSLAVALSPLDPAQMSVRIAGLEVIQETDTPIGAALRQVPGDLARASGTRVVVLITDGEETCGGDPAAAVRAIRAKGIDARVNIVGFGLSDKRLKKAMQGWARLGKGDYFDARDSRQLARAVAAAVSAPYRVLDADGNEVAAGTVGGAAVKVPPGTYSVVVLADPTVRFDAVEVSPGKRLSLTLPEAAE